MTNKGTLLTTAVVLALLALAGSAFADLPTIWRADEPPDMIPLDYYDGEPGGSALRPNEIWSMWIMDNPSIDGKFTFKIETNFGNQAARATYENYLFKDSYSSWKLENLVAGDLYIARYDKPDEEKNTPAVLTNTYGLVLETRTGPGSDVWGYTLTDAGYAPYAAKTAGQLYEIGASGFATGTYEGYGAYIDEMPDMDLARDLDGLIDLDPNPVGLKGYAVNDLLNAYPTILLAGNLINTPGSASWHWYGDEGDWTDAATSPLGYWSGSFMLPDYDPENEYIEVWWSMGCGNDAVMIGTLAGGEPVPTPSSLLLCGIGVAFAAVGRRFRRKRS